jgi:DNA/RNA-binding domain of Phe-tRNA-synthetase-like protein
MTGPAPPDPPVQRGWVDAAVAAELPGLAVSWTVVAARARPSPGDVRGRLRALADRLDGAQAIALRQRDVPHAYRVFFRHVGLDPDVRRTPVEGLVLERMAAGGLASRGLPADALAIATLETSVPVWALDAARLDGDPGVTTGPDGRLALADAAGPVGELFGALAPDREVTRATRSIALVAVAVAGVPAIHVDEALWIAADVLLASS